MIKPRTPSGVMELLPRQQIAFQRMLDTIRRGYERFGFVPVETAVFELADILLTKEGGETEKQVYFVQSTGALQQGHAPEMALRFDLTVPLARYVAEHERDLAFPFRRYQIQKVYRGERPQKGREREFYQCDIDVIGKDTLPIAYDAEMPAVIYHIFRELNVGDFTININNRKLLSGLFEGFGLATPDRQGAALRAIDKLDKIGREAVLTALTQPEVGMTADKARRLLDLLHITGSNATVLAALRQAGVNNPTFAQGLSELESVDQNVATLGVPEGVCQVNLSIARGLDYYTGTVYETILTKFPNFGSVCSGGRYENLAGHYTKSHLPGVGISIGATRLFQALLEDGAFANEPSTVQVLVAQLDPSLMAEYLAIAKELRGGGVNTEVHMDPAKMAKQMKYADRAGIPVVLMLGPDEIVKGVVTIKDLKTGTQHTVERSKIVSAVRSLLPNL